VSGTANDAVSSPPVETPGDILGQVSALCLTLPEVTVRVEASLTKSRSTAHSFDIRRRSFCLLVALEGRTGKPVPLLVLRADPAERDALVSIGHPFFAPRAGRGRIGVRLTDDTDWEEIRELVTESYREGCSEEAHRIARLAGRPAHQSSRLATLPGWARLRARKPASNRG